MKSGNKTLRLSLVAFLCIQIGCAEGPSSNYNRTGKGAVGTGNGTGTGTGGTGTGTGGTGTGGTGTGGTGTGGTGGGGGTTVLSGNIKVPADRGYQNMPWEEFQAEDAIINGGIKMGPSRAKWDINHIEAEAIGRMAVKLAKTGDSVTFKPTKPGNSIVVRLSIPDSPKGGGISSTIGVYIDGKRVKSLPVTSKYAWSYNGGEIGNPKTDDPTVNSKFPHTFFDESRSLLPAFPAGAEIKLQRDAEDSAEFYVIDLVDFENVADPLPMPAGFTSIIDISQNKIKPNDGIDHGDDLIDIMNAAKPGAKIYFPPGVYLAQKFVTHKENAGIDNPGLAITGAGMWHTELRGRQMIWFCKDGAKCDYSDFSLYGESVARAEEIDGVQKAFAGPQGSGSTFNNIWIEHVVGAIWVGNDPPYQMSPTSNLKITNCRIRNTYADGINFDNGTHNSSAKNCHFRNTGDDAAVVWSVKWTDWVKEKSYQAGPDFIKANGKGAPDQGVAYENTYENLTVQMPWRANCFASYGGYGNIWKNSVCEDVLTYPGILIDNEFSPYPFSAGPKGDQPNTFRDIHLIRAGGPMFLEPTPWEHGALKFYQREGSVTDIVVENLDIVDPTYAGIEFKGFGTKFIPPGEKFEPDMVKDAENAKFKNIFLKNITITNAGTYGIEVGDAGGQGEVNFENVKVVNPKKGGLLNKDNNAPASFFIKKGTNEGW